MLSHGDTIQYLSGSISYKYGRVIIEVGGKITNSYLLYKAGEFVKYDQVTDSYLYEISNNGEDKFKLYEIINTGMVVGYHLETMGGWTQDFTH